MICLVEVEKLLHIEGFSKKRVERLTKEIKELGFFNKPIRVEKNYLLVLDGQHRMEAAKKLNLKYIPCQLFHYDDVDVWSLRDDYEVSRQIVIDRALRGDIYPYKTAKHRFPGDIPQIKISLSELRG
jgi:L-serine kinase (ADP)